MTILIITALATTVPCLGLWFGDARQHHVRT